MKPHFKRIQCYTKQRNEMQLVKLAYDAFGNSNSDPPTEVDLCVIYNISEYMPVIFDSKN